jgi:hypothetical protein
MLASLLNLSLIALQAFAVAPKGPWDQFNFAPNNRTNFPVTIRSTHGNVTNALNLLGSGSATLTGNGSFLVVDFGQEVILSYASGNYYVIHRCIGWRPSLSEC